MALKVVKSKNTMLPQVAVMTQPVVEPEVQKTLVEPAAIEAMTAVDTEALVSEYVELYKKFEYFEVKALVKRMETIRKYLVGVANETMDADLPAVFTSPQGKVFFSERSKASVVANPLALVQNLLEKLGPEAAASVVDIAITPLRKLLSEAELKSYLTEEPGGRTIKAVHPKT